ncbi:iron-sulfur cluster-binding protein [Photobacterium frigidiphilum]|nr:FAD-binding oxidoreductase [Photobacterium frigidiphilum]
MMFNMTPVPIEVVDFYDDGQDTRHYHFRLHGLENGVEKETLSAWQKAQSGQFFMLSLPGVGEAPFTFTELPNEQGKFGALVRQMGSVTHALFECAVGDIIGARGPFGKGWPMAAMADQRILIIGGGCGIAPLASVINELIETQNYRQLEVIYATRNSATLMLNPERARWRHFIPLFNVVEDTAGLSDPDYYQGTVLGLLPTVLHSFGTQPDLVLMAGPEAMMEAAAEYLVAYGIQPDAINLSIERRMHCAVGLCGHCYLQDRYVCTDGPTFTWADIRQYQAVG